MRPLEPHGQPGTSLIGFGKPSPNLDSSKEGSYLKWSNQFLSWAVTNTCDNVLKEVSDPIVSQGLNRRSQQGLDYRCKGSRGSQGVREHN